MEMATEATPWTETARLVGVPTSPRMTDLLQVAYFAWLKQTTDPSKKPEWCVDISQGVERKPWSEVPRTFGQTSLEYSFSLDRVLDGEDRRHQPCR